ncbi:helix-turn-helix transcriptional regulator [Rhodoferax sp.]|uniref:helix-turn-helix transcriptional regulator n=1 Tax=Rhodoferax sp. TaxID=50421 RepID=UPI0025D9B590|nr:helix-turn-helix transcriptional regulator [Rhodoferax sp.]
MSAPLPNNPPGLSVLDMQLLHQLGDRIKRTRKARGLGTVAVAQQAGMSRTTLYAVESGDPNASMGSYLRVMACLGLSGELAMVASDVMQPAQAGTAAGRSHRPRPTVQVTVSTDRSRHQVQDLQSLALHAAAVRLVKEDGALRDKASQVVQKWLHDDPTSRSAPLWQEWQAILKTGAFRKAAGRSVRAQQLRQASPLATILPAEMRLSILNEVSQLKAGVVLGAPAMAVES